MACVCEVCVRERAANVQSSVWAFYFHSSIIRLRWTSWLFRRNSSERKRSHASNEATTAPRHVYFIFSGSLGRFHLVFRQCPPPLSLFSTFISTRFSTRSHVAWVQKLHINIYKMWITLWHGSTCLRAPAATVAACRYVLPCSHRLTTACVRCNSVGCIDYIAFCLDVGTHTHVKWSEWRLHEAFDESLHRYTRLGSCSLLSIIYLYISFASNERNVYAFAL